MICELLKGFLTLTAASVGLQQVVLAEEEPKYSVNTFVGQAYEYGTANGFGPLARFQQQEGIAADKEGNLYVADSGNTMIRKISRTGEVTTLAGAKAMTFQDVLDDVGHGYKDGTGRNAKFSNTSGIAVDDDGNVYVSDHGNYVIRKITPAGVVTTLAGTPGTEGIAVPHLASLNKPYREGSVNVATFGHIEGLAVDADGNVYVADEINSVIRKVTPAGVSSTFVGKPGEPGYRLGTGQNARIGSPRGIAISPDGDLIVADNANNCVWKITPGATVSKLAGGGSIEPLSMGRGGYVDATGDDARFGVMWGIAVRPDGNVLVTDAHEKTIRMITPGGKVTTVAGGQGQVFPGDNYGPNSGFADPVWLTVDPFGNLYVSEKSVYRIRKGVVPKPDTPPTFAIPPRNEIVPLGGLAAFPYLVKGTAPYRIEVRKDGVLRNPGSPISTEGLVIYNWISPFTEDDAGDYEITIRNDFGSVTSQMVSISIFVDPMSLLENPLDNDQLEWTNAGDRPWSGQTAIAHDEVDAARSGAIEHNESAILRTTVTGPGTLTFWWKVSSEGGYDMLDFRIGISSPSLSISGEVDWRKETVAVGTGIHELNWTYSKDGSATRGQDAGWVDQVVWIPSTSGTPYDTWKSSFFNPTQLANPAISGDDADFDNDGIKTLLEFVLGGSPTSPGSNLLNNTTTTPAAVGRNLVFSYDRKTVANGITQVIETSSTLTGTWTPAVHGVNGVVITNSTLDANTQRITATIPSTETILFARLKANR